jgi:transmembrane sensor
VHGDELACDHGDDSAVESCPACAAELEAAHLFDTLLVPRAPDEALGRAAIAGALAQLEARPRAGAGWRRVLRPATGVAALAAASAVALLFVLLPGPRPWRRPEPRATSAPAITLADGSEIAPEGPAQIVRVDEETTTRTVVHLRSGGARFRIRHDDRRVFRIDAGPFEIDDLGTVFRVSHEPEGRIRVKVSEGRVVVRCAASQLHVELGPGDDRVFAPPSAEPSPPLAEQRRAPAPPAVAGTTRIAPRPDGASVSSDGPSALLLAADVARRSNRPAAAVPPLRRFVAGYPKDPRAASAAFTLGWVLQTDLNQPREAALAFAEAERLARRGVLAEDAAARVAEAWRDAGDPSRAARAAAHYEQTYPKGQSLTLMRGLTGGH